MIAITRDLNFFSDDRRVDLRLKPMCINKNLAETIDDVLFSAYKNGVLTISDRRVLISASEDKSLDMEAQRVVKRLLYAIHRGWVKTLDGDSQ